jgi:hypothetical protein
MTSRDPAYQGASPARRRRWLLLLLPPLLMSGCSVLGAKGRDAGAGDGAGTASGGQWLVFSEGKATPSPTPSRGAAPSPAATGLPRSSASSSARPSPTPSCSRDTPHFDKINALQVVPGTTSATVTWYNVGGYNLTEFRVTAISQDLVVGKQRDVGWVAVKSANPCGYLTATVPNLERRTGYVFSVDAVVYRRSGDGTHAATIFRSSVVHTR